jgi:Ca2+-dependent lipid-binding protein
MHVKTSCFYSIEDCCQLSAPGTLTLHLNLALIAGTICKMEQRELEVTIISAQDLKNVSTFGKMTPYAVAWVYSNMKVSTPIDPKGSVNPTWNAPLKLIVEQQILEQPNATLNVDIYSYGSFSNKHVGSCSVPLSHLKEKDSKGADTKKFMSFLVCIC